MVIGVNVGSAISSHIVALGQITDQKQFERAYTAATVNCLFNILTALLMFPMEFAFGFLEWLTFNIVDDAETRRTHSWESPMSKAVKPLTRKIIVSNPDRIRDVALGNECDSFYPTNCTTDGSSSYNETCQTGFLGCTIMEKEGVGGDNVECPLWFANAADLRRDKLFATLTIFLALIALYVSIVGMCACLQRLIRGVSTRVVYKATTINGYIAVLVGIGASMVLESSAVTSSILVPPLGIGALRLEEVYPFMVGANVVIAVSGALTSLVSTTLDALHVATVHVFFNVAGFLIWYAIPHLRHIPITMARKLGEAVRVWRYCSLAYILVVYFSFPLISIGIAELLYNGREGFGIGLAVFVGLVLVPVLYICFNVGMLEDEDIL